MSTPDYRGRFAPSPTGELHFGSLVAAVASFVDARQHDGCWLVRIDDVDQTRTVPGAETSILNTLERFGMHSDEPPIRQSDRTVRYRDALHRLQDKNLVYRCTCSRKTIATIARAGREGPIYPGTCRRSPPGDNGPAAWRFHVEHDPIRFTDRVFGEISQDLADDIGDFVVYRVDGFCAYQLAVVIDDADQDITHVVRGADLLWSTPRQLALQRSLDLPPPRYTHIPLVYDEEGRKLSKRDAAHPVDPSRPLEALIAAWRHLGQTEPPRDLHDCGEFWQFAVSHWSVDRIAAVTGYDHE
jgi:glutamyl-Q tRNA(Asp) synthetase